MFSMKYFMSEQKIQNLHSGGKGIRGYSHHMLDFGSSRNMTICVARNRVSNNTPILLCTFQRIVLGNNRLARR